MNVYLLEFFQSLSKHAHYPFCVDLYKLRKSVNFNTKQRSFRLGRRRVLLPAKDLVKMLEETSTKVSISTVKQKPLLQNYHTFWRKCHLVCLHTPPLAETTSVGLCMDNARNMDWICL
uniref:Uncharacterized protein n=1 Tax=Esox lucius TaxID=8010 RepID=A0AAY5KX23_ESOLU